MSHVSGRHSLESVAEKCDPATDRQRKEFGFLLAIP